MQKSNIKSQNWGREKLEVGYQSAEGRKGSRDRVDRREEHKSRSLPVRGRTQTGKSQISKVKMADAENGRRKDEGGRHGREERKAKCKSQISKVKTADAPQARVTSFQLAVGRDAGKESA